MKLLTLAALLVVSTSIVAAAPSHALNVRTTAFDPLCLLNVFHHGLCKVSCLKGGASGGKCNKSLKCVCNPPPKRTINEVQTQDNSRAEPEDLKAAHDDKRFHDESAPNVKRILTPTCVEDAFVHGVCKSKCRSLGHKTGSCMSGVCVCSRNKRDLQNGITKAASSEHDGAMEKLEPNDS